MRIAAGSRTAWRCWLVILLDAGNQSGAKVKPSGQAPPAASSGADLPAPLRALLASPTSVATRGRRLQPLKGGTTSDALSADSGVGPGAPGPSVHPAPGASGSSCPVSFPPPAHPSRVSVPRAPCAESFGGQARARRPPPRFPGGGLRCDHLRLVGERRPGRPSGHPAGGDRHQARRHPPYGCQRTAAARGLGCAWPPSCGGDVGTLGTPGSLMRRARSHKEGKPWTV
jgi:hypothetical protein